MFNVLHPNTILLLVKDKSAQLNVHAKKNLNNPLSDILASKSKCVIVEYELTYHVGVIMFHVVGCSLPPPSLTVYRPSTNPLSSSQATLVCLARQMYIGFAEVSWLVNGSPVTDGTTTSTAGHQLDETFQISYLSLQARDFSEDRTYTCKVALGSDTFEKTIRMSECNAVE